jgi:hypothetical protein
MWPKRTVAAIGETIAIEWQRSGATAEWRYGTACGVTMITSSITDGGEVAGGGQESCQAPISVASGILGGGGELAVGPR